jgi:hypothetical protein
MKNIPSICSSPKILVEFSHLHIIGPLTYFISLPVTNHSSQNIIQRSNYEIHNHPKSYILVN